MAKKQIKESIRKTTEWNLGQPLAFPLKKDSDEFGRRVREAIDEAMSGSVRGTRPKQRRRK